MQGCPYWVRTSGLQVEGAIHSFHTEERERRQWLSPKGDRMVECGPTGVNFTGPLGL